MVMPQLASFIQVNKMGVPSINFSNPKAVKLLNQAILHHYYGIGQWEFPDNNLYPPIPGRADYIHYLADILSESNEGKIPKGKNITCLDIGVGATCIYPIIGVTEYEWNFIGADISVKSIASSQQIVSANQTLSNKITFRQQTIKKQIFKGIIHPTDRITATICNPPFHESKEAANKGSQRKIKNLSGKKAANPTLNFSGNSNELIYKGGEIAFIKNMISESLLFKQNCCWFTTLVSKKGNLKTIEFELQKIGVKEIKTIPMATGNKTTRIVAWSFLSPTEQKVWMANQLK